MSTDTKRNEHYFDPAKFGITEIGQIQHRDTKDMTSTKFGVGFETLDRGMFYPEPCYPHLAKLGAKWARIQSGWSKCETEKGVYDFAWLDAIVDGLLDVGVMPWMSLCFGNKLYMDDPAYPSAVGYVPMYYGDEVIAAWDRYVQATVEHFKDRVTYYEVWNEPNIGNFWQPKGVNPTDYAKFVVMTSASVRKILPGATMIGGCVAAGGYATAFLEAAFAAGMAEHIDILTYHPYRDTPELSSDVEDKTLRQMCNKYKPSLRIWQGETGTPSIHGGHHDFLCENTADITETTQAKWAIRRLVMDQRNDIEMTSYFHTADLDKATYYQSFGKPLKPVMMGLLNGADYSPKESYHAMRNVCNLFDEDTKLNHLFHAIHFNGQFGSEDKSCEAKFNMDYAAAITASFERKGYPLYTFWVPNIPVKTYDALNIELLIIPKATRELDEPVLVDLLTGKVYRVNEYIKNETGVVWGNYVCQIPLTDYPLVITDRKAL
ncbi:MAG: glycosyl hydrolase [Phycisphaeraceae bacterium JB051]